MRCLLLFLLLFASLMRGTGMAYILSPPQGHTDVTQPRFSLESVSPASSDEPQAAADGDMGAMVEMAGQKATEKALGKATEATGSALQEDFEPDKISKNTLPNRD